MTSGIRSASPLRHGLTLILTIVADALQFWILAVLFILALGALWKLGNVLEASLN
ncbi:hypothetical protein GGQ74_001170 [Desulfobaculum xiamenense]|uniref:Uncharacterized protein n=1 Tax=Desulfobaculum xiamenense TaxID=995050 RepID=A0A846QKE4_9BACT|nr:hypothetical protein [Desulfobaculum xiamenense]NJB67530.1 hypothetical protein [Desulfobaculum xiamenense]